MKNEHHEGPNCVIFSIPLLLYSER